MVGTEVDVRTGQGSIVFLDAATLEEVQTIDGPGDFLTSVGVGTDGGPIVAGGGSGDVYVWRTPDGTPEAEGGHGPDGFTYVIRYGTIDEHVRDRCPGRDRVPARFDRPVKRKVNRSTRAWAVCTASRSTRTASGWRRATSEDG